MHRWLPLGRDNTQLLSLYPYAIAYTHKAIAAVLPNVTLYHVTFYMPVICFCIGLAALCLFLYHTYGLLFSSLVGFLLAILPGSVDRSAAGYSDRDAFCLMIGILAVVTYLVSLQADTSRKRLTWTLASGFIVFLGGLSWEGFGVFLSVIIVVELYRFIATETEDGLGRYALWVCCFVPTLYLASPAYRNGYGFAEHLAAFMLLPPLVVLGIRTIRCLLLANVKKLRPHARTLSLGLTLASIVLALSYVFTQLDTFADTTVPLQKNMLMQTVIELRPPRLRYWHARYGILFILSGIGTILMSLSLCKRYRTFSFFAFALFTFTTFFRYPFVRMFGVPLGNGLFAISLVGCVLAFIGYAWQRNRIDDTLPSRTLQDSEYIAIAFLTLFIVWTALARDAKRYHFFTAIPLAFFATESIRFFAYYLANKIYIPPLTQKTCTTILTGALLSLLLFLPPLGGFALNAHTLAGKINRPFPGEAPITKAYQWMRTSLPNTAVLAARWRYGNQLNVLADVKTIIDPDHYIQQWIHLHRQYISLGLDEREMLIFLKTHEATHLMIPQRSAPYSIEQAQASGALVPVYPTQNFTDAKIKIWEIHYPPDIKTDLKYLKTGVPEIDEDLQLQ